MLKLASLAMIVVQQTDRPLGIKALPPNHQKHSGPQSM